MTTTDLPLRCRCGVVRGTAASLSRSSSNHAVCYCADCQAFARFLGTPDVMDARGGTEIFQVAPALVRITEGLNAVACVRLSEKGLLRFYAGCCRTPIGNMVGPRVPFIGVIHSFVDRAGGWPRDDVLGKAVGIYGRSAIGGAPPGVHATAPLGLLLQATRKLLTWWVMGKGTPSAFFDVKTGEPVVTPTVLSLAEREALGPRPVAQS